MSTVVAEENIPGHISIEKEWRELARTLPRGHARDILEAGLPLGMRKEVSSLVAGGSASSDTAGAAAAPAGTGSASMVSRTRRQQRAADAVDNVHWKLRNAVDDIVSKHLDRLDKSAEMAIRSISSGTVMRARNTIDTAKSKHDAADMLLSERADRIMRSLRGRGVAYDDILHRCATKTSNQRAQHVNKLSNLLG